ncbi:MAG: transposase [Nanoarchaeota archaeon]
MTHYLNKSISIPWPGNAWKKELCADIAESARTTGYMESISNKADCLHKYVQMTDENSIKRAYEVVSRSGLKKLGLNEVELAIDGKKVLFYGKKAGLGARGIKHENGTSLAREYLVVSIVSPVHLPLMAVRYYQGADLADLCIELLEYVRTLMLKVNLVLFDRGFKNAKLIDYLESKRRKKPWNYLILATQDDAIKEYIRQTDEIGKKCASYKHEFSYSYKKSTWNPSTRYVVCKDAFQDKRGKWHGIVFATNLVPKYSLIKRYKKRWNIETGFRVMEEVK